VINVKDKISETAHNVAEKISSGAQNAATYAKETVM